MTTAATKCACPSFDAMECVRLRYASYGDDYYDPSDDDPCECPCHLEYVLEDEP